MSSIWALIVDWIFMHNIHTLIARTAFALLLTLTAAESFATDAVTGET